MTLLTICQDAALEVGIEPPTAIVGSTAPAARRLLRYAKRIGLDIVSRANWGVLRTQHAFDATPGEEQLDALPDDFARMIPETFYDRGAQSLIIGAVTAPRWQANVATNRQDARWFALREGKLYVFPGFVGGENLYFEYVSRTYCATSGGTAQSAWAADTDVGRVSEELFTLGVIAFYKMNEGLPWEGAMDDYQRRFNREFATDQPRNRILSAGDIFGGARNWDGTPPASGVPGNGSLGLPLS